MLMFEGQGPPAVAQPADPVLPKFVGKLEQQIVQLQEITAA